MRRMLVPARLVPLAILIVATSCGSVGSDAAAVVAPASTAPTVHATDHCVCGTPEGDLLGCTAHDCPNRVGAREEGR